MASSPGANVAACCFHTCKRQEASEPLMQIRVLLWTHYTFCSNASPWRRPHAAGLGYSAKSQRVKELCEASPVRHLCAHTSALAKPQVNRSVCPVSTQTRGTQVSALYLRRPLSPEVALRAWSWSPGTCSPPVSAPLASHRRLLLPRVLLAARSLRTT